jgi:type I restriction enzyme, S subunit
VGQNGLPEGWRLVTLPDLCDINPPKPSADALPPNAPVTFVPMPAVDAEKGAITKPEARPFGKVRKGYTSFREDDVIMAKITPCMENGKAAIARALHNGLGFGSTEFHVFRSNGAILPDFLYHFIRQESFRKAAEHEMTGSVGQKRVPASFLDSVEIPLPPLAEQKRIVAKIEELLARVNATRERLAKVQAILKRFRQAVLAAACTGRLTEDWRSKRPVGETWQKVKLSEVATSRLGKMLDKVKNRGNLTPYLRNLNVRWFGFDLSDIQKIRVTEAETIDLSVREGDVLVCEGGEPGRCAIWHGPSGVYVYQKALHRVRVGERLKAEWLCYCLKNAADSGRLADLFTGTTIKHFTGISLRHFDFDLPPIGEQHEIVHRVEAIFELSETIVRRATAGTHRTQQLASTILAKAFRGELVTTEAGLARREERSYEPASELLRRAGAPNNPAKPTPVENPIINNLR